MNVLASTLANNTAESWAKIPCQSWDSPPIRVSLEELMKFQGSPNRSFLSYPLNNFKSSPSVPPQLNFRLFAAANQIMHRLLDILALIQHRMNLVDDRRDNSTLPRQMKSRACCWISLRHSG